MQTLMELLWALFADALNKFLNFKTLLTYYFYILTYVTVEHNPRDTLYIKTLMMYPEFLSNIGIHDQCLLSCV